jgi:hypothetical protein
MIAEHHRQSPLLVAGSTIVLPWIAASVLAESLAVILAGRMHALTLGPAALSMFVEAIVLGVVQMLILRRTIPGLERAWLTATVAGTMAGRLLQFGIDMGAAHAVPVSWGAPFEYAGGFALGAFIGAVMAVPQALVLRHRLPGAERWILARALAWACALPALLLLFSIEAGIQAAARANGVMLVVATFALVAAGVGAIEGIVMTHLIREARHPASA